MRFFYEKLIARIWNWVVFRRPTERRDHDLDLGFKVTDEEITRHRVGIRQSKRAEHIAILGKTGTGKSSLHRYLSKQDIHARRGFVCLDLHGDSTPFILSEIAAEEKRSNQDLSEKLIVIEPADPLYSVGQNPLQGVHSFVGITEFAEIIKRRCHLESYGARTEELLRNSLYALAENDLTLIELSPLLANASFRTFCLKHVRNADVRQYFEERYGRMSDPMQAVMREPILNKVSAFTADPAFRHILGQRTSTFSWLDAMDQGQ